MATLDEVKADADALSTALDNLIARVEALIAQLEANAADPAKIQAIADELTAATVKANAERP